MAGCDTCGGCSKTKSATIDYKTIVGLLTNVLDKHINLEEGHSHRVSEMATWLGTYLGIDQQMVDFIGVASYLHDIGMLDVSGDILGTRKLLEADDWLQIKKHPLQSAKYIETLPGLDEVARIVLEHHERFDGGGYPTGLEGDYIHLGARILHFCEAIDTMANDQTYKDRMTYEAIEAEVKKQSGKQFDPWMVMHVSEFLTIYQEKFDQ